MSSGKPPRYQPFNFRLIPELADLEQMHNFAVSQGQTELAEKIRKDMILGARKYITAIKKEGIASLPRGKVVKLGSTRRNRRRNRRFTRKY